MAKTGNKLLLDIQTRTNETFDKQLSCHDMSEVLHAMGVHWTRLKTGYYRSMHDDHRLVVRREKIAAVLRELLHHDHIVVWKYDQVRPVFFRSR